MSLCTSISRMNNKEFIPNPEKIMHVNQCIQPYPLIVNDPMTRLICMSTYYSLKYLI